MIFFFFSLLWASLAGAPVAAPVSSSPDYLNCHFVPGWEQSGTVRQYTADNLFDYRDGAAEGYLIYNFVRMRGIDCQSGSATLAIDVSEMTDPDFAYGMFSANRDPKEPIAKFGMGGQLLPQSLLFAKGKYFVEIIETDGNPNSNQTEVLKEFAARMEPLLEGPDTPPQALNWFPTENQVSVKLVPESVLGLRILKRGYVAQYKQGQAFVVLEDSPQTAAETFKKLRERFQGAASTQIADEAFQAKAQYLGGICVFRKGRYLGGYANMPETEGATSQAATLAAGLP